MGSQVQGFHLVECQSGQRVCWRAADTVVCVFGCFEGGVCRQYVSVVDDSDGLRQHLEIVLGNDALCSCLGGFRFVNIQRVGEVIASTLGNGVLARRRRQSTVPGMSDNAMSMSSTSGAASSSKQRVNASRPVVAVQIMRIVGVFSINVRNAYSAMASLSTMAIEKGLFSTSSLSCTTFMMLYVLSFGCSAGAEGSIAHMMHRPSTEEHNTCWVHMSVSCRFMSPATTFVVFS